jgi:hypothetical protein
MMAQFDLLFLQQFHLLAFRRGPRIAILGLLSGCPSPHAVPVQPTVNTAASMG